MESIKQILMRRDGMDSIEAEEYIKDAIEQLQEYIEDGNMQEAEDICQEYFGLEPDYIMELL